MKRGTDGYYHLLYKTTNLINDHFYIGIHSTRILEDGYLGSGRRLKAEVAKYGKENFTREILECCVNRVILTSKEKEIVTEELRRDELCINLTNGGDGDFTFCNSNKDKKYYQIRSDNGKLTGKENGSASLKKILAKNPKRFLEICSMGGKTGGKITGPRNVKSMNTPETNEKRKEKYKEIGHQQGEKNSQFGTCWIYHELIGSKTCKKELLPEYLEQGWIKGRKMIYGVSI